MKSILLIGLGRFGSHVARKLDEMNHEVLAIDQDEERVQSVLPYVRNAQIGDTTDEAFMRSLGINNFDVCIVTIDDNFQDSLVTTSLLKEMGAKLVVSRASNDVHAKFLLKNGADQIVYPERQFAIWTAIRYGSEHVLDYIRLDEDNAIFEIDVPAHWLGKTVQTIDIRKQFQLNIVAIKKNGQLNSEIGPEYCFSGEETVLVIGKYNNIKKCFRL